jgi:hypothetical protein
MSRPLGSSPLPLTLGPSPILCPSCLPLGVRTHPSASLVDHPLALPLTLTTLGLGPKPVLAVSLLDVSGRPVVLSKKLLAELPAGLILSSVQLKGRGPLLVPQGFAFVLAELSPDRASLLLDAVLIADCLKYSGLSKALTSASFIPIPSVPCRSRVIRSFLRYLWGTWGGADSVFASSLCLRKNLRPPTAFLLGVPSRGVPCPARHVPSPRGWQCPASPLCPSTCALHGGRSP